MASTVVRDRLRRRRAERAPLRIVPSQADAQTWPWHTVARDGAQLSQMFRQFTNQHTPAPLDWDAPMRVVLVRWLVALTDILHGRVPSEEQTMEIMRLTEAVLHHARASAESDALLGAEHEDTVGILRAETHIHELLEDMCSCSADDALLRSTQPGDGDGEPSETADIDDQVAQMARASAGATVALGRMAESAQHRHAHTLQQEGLALLPVLDMCFRLAVMTLADGSLGGGGAAGGGASTTAAAEVLGRGEEASAGKKKRRGKKKRKGGKGR